MTKAKSKTKQMKRAFVSLPSGVWDIIHHDLKGRLGEGDSEIIRNIVIAYLSDKGYFMNEEAGEGFSDIEDQVTVLNHMITSLVEALEEKGAITFSEWDRIMKKKIATEGSDNDYVAWRKTKEK